MDRTVDCEGNNMLGIFEWLEIAPPGPENEAEKNPTNQKKNGNIHGGNE